MLAWTLLAVASSTALAAGPSDDQIHLAVEKLANRNLPKRMSCVARPDLPDVFRSAVPVGLRRGARGCVLLGVWIGTSIRDTDGAAALAIRESAWTDMKDTERAEALRAWTQGILLAFGQPEGDGSVRASRGKAVVEQTWLHRADGSGLSARSTGSFTFSLKDGALLEQSATPQQYWRTGMTTRPDGLSGNLTTDNVSAAINTYGKVVKDCFTTHWESRDLTYDGRVRISWTLAEGKASNWGVEGSDDPPAELYKCYINEALAQIEWPEDLAGDANWVFAAARGEAEAPE